MEKRISEFYQNATLTDSQVIAYAYRPIPVPVYNIVKSALPLASVEPPFVIELTPDLPNIQVEAIGATDSVMSDKVGHQDSDLSSRSQSVSRNIKLVKKQRAVSEIDSPLNPKGNLDALQVASGGPVTPDKFYQEVVKGQTFLGLGAFAFQPKPVRSVFWAVFWTYLQSPIRMFWTLLKILVSLEYGLCIFPMPHRGSLRVCGS